MKHILPFPHFGRGIGFYVLQGDLKINYVSEDVPGLLISTFQNKYFTKWNTLLDSTLAFKTFFMCMGFACIYVCALCVCSALQRLNHLTLELLMDRHVDPLKGLFPLSCLSNPLLKNLKL